MTCKTDTHAAPRPWGNQTATLGAILGGIWAKLLNWQGRAIARNHAEMLSDHQLRDIGLTRAQLLSALR
jgi:uncharacterized protein YjiS (DUF1127 family)